MLVYRLARRGRIDDLDPREEPVPRPGYGQALVRVRAVALNYRDLAMVYGHYFTDAPDGLIPVSDAAGEVVEVGAGVTRVAVGDRVLSVFNPRWYGGPYPGTADDEYGTAQDGWLAEYKAVSAESLVPAPAGMSFTQAATLPCAAVTAWTALTGPRPLTAADTVLTQGSGGVSLFALQLAKLVGARVIATTSGPAKAERLTALGADEVLDYTKDPDWGAAVRELTGGRGVDRIVEVGGSATFAQSLIAGNDRAEIDVIGFLGRTDWELGFMDLFTGGFETMRRIRVGSREDAEGLLRLLDRHGLEPVIDSVHPIERTLDAWRRLDSRANFGKVVITL